MVSSRGRRLKYICLSSRLSLAWSHFSPVVNNHFSPVVNQSCPASFCKTLSSLKYNNESLGHSIQDQAISDRTWWKNLLRVLVGELWMCPFAIWSAQDFKRKLSFSVGLGLFHLPFLLLYNAVVALRPVAAVRGSSKKFPAFSEWKRYLSRTTSSRTPYLPFHGVQPFRMMQASKLGRRAGRSRPCATSQKRN